MNWESNSVIGKIKAVFNLEAKDNPSIFHQGQKHPFVYLSVVKDLFERLNDIGWVLSV